MLKSPVFAITLFVAAALFGAAAAQDPLPIPTLAVPTLVAYEALDNPTVDLPPESAVTEIISSGVFRVGVLYNEPPYSQFTLQGDLRGFEIDILRLIAETWGIDVEFIQVTRENALDRLNRGRAHAVASAFVHYRNLDDQIAFSQTFMLGRQAMMVRADSPFQSLTELVGPRIGYVIGTRSEYAVGLWSAQLEDRLNPQFYLTLDRAFAALAGGEIDGLVAEEQDLLRVTAGYADRARILDEALLREPRAFAVRRHDASLRNLLSHSIQLLARDGRLRRLFQEYFPESELPEDAIALWAGIGETVDPTQYAGEPPQSLRVALPQLLGAGVLRVGGIVDGEQLPSASEAQLNALNLALVHEMGRRWGVSVETFSSSAADAIDLLARGELDIVAGMQPDWLLAASMDFSDPYFLHGDRLMVGANSRIAGFNDLRGRIIGLVIGDEGARERAQAWADSINASVRFFQTREAGAALQLLEFNNVNAVYADSLLLAAHLQANPNALRLTDRWYSRSSITFGLPYNDPDFRLLVNYTIQELARDGTLERLSGALIVSDDLPDFEITPGESQVAGINLAGA
ncbi:MAG: transporter substrate-binding domain-containing protein [Chloroflexota bacterium]|nr:transporter substrate-binding domain-containing protein [Chloroflexota bacterium]MDE2908049.1 transporter substrate-binding domain-containing protein [Chloroflexota bacterium]